MLIYKSFFDKDANKMNIRMRDKNKNPSIDNVYLKVNKKKIRVVDKNPVYKPVAGYHDEYGEWVECVEPGFLISDQGYVYDAMASKLLKNTKRYSNQVVTLIDINGRTRVLVVASLVYRSFIDKDEMPNNVRMKDPKEGPKLSNLYVIDKKEKHNY